MHGGQISPYIAWQPGVVLQVRSSRLAQMLARGTQTPRAGRPQLVQVS
jgi:hypothetical protein